MSRSLWNNETSSGFTFIELIVVVGIIGVLSAVAIPTYTNFIEMARKTKVIAELRLLGIEILGFYALNERLPLDLDELGRANMKDPWGNPYVYLNFETIKGKGKGKMRKDRFLVPINTDYDLCIMGPDGKTNTPLTAKASRDDIIRANNGSYVGPASEF